MRYVQLLSHSGFFPICVIFVPANTGLPTQVSQLDLALQKHGGEEFIILLPGTKLNGAQVVAEQIRETISSKKFKNTQTGQKLGNITVSIGVAEIRQGDTAITLVERADASLYLAKENGRNNVKSETDLKKKGVA